MLMQTAPIPRDHSFVLVIRDTLEMEPLVLVNESFPSCWSSLAVRFIGAMKIISRLIPEDHSTARVIRDILEMESLVLVK